MADEKEGISTLSCVCVCVNMMIGAGFLALPYGFQHGGILSSICKVNTILCGRKCIIMGWHFVM